MESNIKVHDLTYTSCSSAKSSLKSNDPPSKVRSSMSEDSAAMLNNLISYVKTFFKIIYRMRTCVVSDFAWYPCLSWCAWLSEMQIMWPPWRFRVFQLTLIRFAYQTPITEICCGSQCNISWRYAFYMMYFTCTRYTGSDITLVSVSFNVPHYAHTFPIMVAFHSERGMAMDDHHSWCSPCNSPISFTRSFAMASGKITSFTVNIKLCLAIRQMYKWAPKACTGLEHPSANSIVLWSVMPLAHKWLIAMVLMVWTACKSCCMSSDNIIMISMIIWLSLSQLWSWHAYNRTAGWTVIWSLIQ